jgi:hypothetical protein
MNSHARDGTEDRLCARRHGYALVAALMILYTAGYAWSAPHTDTADELVHAYQIRLGISYPVEGPFLGNAIHLGPFWFYLVALPLWISSAWISAALFVGAICSAKFPLAYYCGRKLLDRDFGVLWAVALFVPGWSTLEQLVFLNPNAVAASTLLVAAICLHGFSSRLGPRGFGCLGLALALAIHVHPTSIPIFVLAAALLWSHHRRGDLGAARWLWLAGGFVVPFLPYIVSQVVAGFPDYGSASRYAAGQMSIANVVNAPAVIAGYIVRGPATMARYVLGWQTEPAGILGYAFAAATLASVAVLSAGARARAVLAALLVALLVFSAWIACMRPTTPMQFAWVLNPVFGALIALAMWVLAKHRGLRWLAVLVMASSIGFNACVMGAMAGTVDEGEGRLPSAVLDIKGKLPAAVYSDVWFPAHAHGALGEALCSSRGRTALHGQLGYVVDKDLGLDTWFACADRSRFVLAAGDADGHYFGMTRPFWRALSWTPDRWVGSLGLTTDVAPIVRQPAIPIALGETYLPRRAATLALGTTEIAGVVPAGRAVMVTNMLGGYEHFEVLSARADGQDVLAVAQDDVARLYKATGAGGAAIHWTFTVRSTNPGAIDAVSIGKRPGAA